jgi:hypothetical protein
LLLLAGVTSAVAAPDDIPGLTDEERVMLGLQGNLTSESTPSAGPSRYVSPRIRVVERQIPPTEPLTDMQRLNAYMVNGSTSNLSSVLTNGGFEDGNFTGWTLEGNLGTTVASACAAVWPADAFITTPGTLAAANNAACLNAVYQDAHSARLGDQFPWGNAPSTEPKCSRIYQDAVIPAGTANFKFAYAVMAQNPGHGVGQDPYFNVKVEDLTDATTLYNVTDYTTSYNPGNPCNPWCAGVSGVVYRCWTEVTLDLSALAGHTVRVSLKGSDCSPSGHWCSVFLDGAAIVCPDNVGPDAAGLNASCAPDATGQTLCATLTWTAPNDASSVPNDQTGNCDPTNVAAAGYDIRWATTPILTDADFAAANLVAGEPTPAAPGSAETMQVCGLPVGNVYFALQSSDASFNDSPITAANVVDCQFNQPPDCSNALASSPVLWPPNHQYNAISILGVTDPDGDPVTITVTGITQDEPLNTRGDGNTCPDGLIEAGQASVRAERTGTPGIPGNGRVYVLSFTATDPAGASCTGSVTVCVPHDMSDPTCVDDGQRHDSDGECRDGNSLASEVTAYGLAAAVNGNEATIEFAVPSDSDVQVGVFDVAGRRLTTLENGRLAMGRYTRTWNMSGVANGLYFVRMNAGAFSSSRTVLKLQ